MTTRPYGDHAVLIEVGGPDAVRRLHTALTRELPHLQARPGWSSVVVRTTVAPSSIVHDLLALDLTAHGDPPESRSHTVEVIYDGADLAAVAALAGCSVSDVVHRHTSPTYRVVMLGFTRAFAYLDGLDASLATIPRLATPRVRVPAGSVGIAAGQTGIYPMASPGGWQLLGHTDAVVFDPLRMPPGLFAPGDIVTFRAR